MSYAPSIADLFYLAAVYVDKILKDAKRRPPCRAAEPGGLAERHDARTSIGQSHNDTVRVARCARDSRRL